jgi:hypothetical protein
MVFLPVDADGSERRRGGQRGFVGGQQRRAAKSPTASRWRLGVERPEVDEDDGFLPLF